MSAFCNYCGFELPSGAKFCPKCGRATDVFQCPSCGKEFNSDADFCIYCGTSLKRAVEVPQALKLETGIEGVSPAYSDAEEIYDGVVLPESPSDTQPKERVMPTDEELRKVIGKNEDYYLSEFGMLKWGQKIKFNWAAFIFGPTFCYYRKSKEICWQFFKTLYIVMGIVSLILVVTGVSNLATKDISSIAIWVTAALIAVLVLAVYQMACSIRCGCQFNKRYFQHCMEVIENGHISEKKTGVSLSSAALFNFVLAVICTVVVGVSAVVTSFTLTRGLWDPALDFSNVMEDPPILPTTSSVPAINSAEPTPAPKERFDDYLGYWSATSEGYQGTAITLSKDGANYSVYISAGSGMRIREVSADLTVDETVQTASGTYEDSGQSSGDIWLDYKNGVLIVSMKMLKRGEFADDYSFEMNHERCQRGRYTAPATLSVKVQGAATTWDYNNNPVIVVTYTWTNDTGTTTAPAYSICCTAFQNGIALDDAYLLDSEHYDAQSSMRDVRPEVTTIVQAAFILADRTSDVEVELKPWMDIAGDGPTITEIFVFDS